MTDLKIVVDILYVVLLIVIIVGLGNKVYQSFWERGITSPILKQVAHDLIVAQKENRELRRELAKYKEGDV